VDKVVHDIGLRQPLPPGKRRHEVQLDHGFRKYFNTMMRRAKVNYLDKEDMMGHTTGLEKHYERYNEEDFERFPEYEKAIPFLTIDPTERQKLEIQRLKEAKSETKSQQSKFLNLEAKINSFENEKYALKKEVDSKINEQGELFNSLLEMFDMKEEFLKRTTKVMNKVKDLL